MPTEFEIIKRFFTKTQLRHDVCLGIGDDCALVKVPLRQVLAISMDTLVAGTHFFADAPAQSIGHKALAVNLSDLAAMGAQPAWVSLALTLPASDLTWLKNFCRGFFALLRQYRLALIGGDTTRGPLSITLQVHGFVPKKQALYRSGAQPGDSIYVTGSLGAAGLALHSLQRKIHISKTAQKSALNALHFPAPRVAEGLALRSIATSAIDISDGLAADLNHILQCSEVGATVFVEQVPIAPVVAKHLPRSAAQTLALSAGDDYELCFTMPPSREKKLARAFKGLVPYTKIGTITQQRGLRFMQNDNQAFKLRELGYQHFVTD